MSKSTWDVMGVDPAARDRAVKEAARRGVPLANYLSDILLEKALADAMPLQATLVEDAEAALTPGKTFAIRHQIKALERHLGSSVTSLDGALSAEHFPETAKPRLVAFDRYAAFPECRCEPMRRARPGQRAQGIAEDGGYCNTIEAQRAGTSRRPIFFDVEVGSHRH